MTALETVSLRVASKLVGLNYHMVLVLARQGYLELVSENGRHMVTKSSIREYLRLTRKGAKP